jgi:anti-sigma factor RsiW
MTTCTGFRALLLDRLTDDVGPADAARLEAHLAGCPACRAEGEALGTALTMASLPPASEPERAALTGLAESVRLEQRRAELGLRPPLRYAAALLAVAAAVAFLLAPAFTRRSPGAPPAAVAAAPQAWEAPDADEVWTAAALASDDGAAAAMAGADELALDALLSDE